MGRTAIRMAQDAMKAVPVQPTTGKDGVKQPAYLRKASTVASSARLLRFRACVASGMLGAKSTTGRVGIKDKFGSVASGCKGK